MGKHKTTSKLVCMHCGGPDVEVQVWMNINDFKISVISESQEGTEGWCEDCGIDTKLVTLEEFNFHKEDLDSHKTEEDV